MGWPKWALCDRRGSTLLQHQLERAAGRYSQILVSVGPKDQALELHRRLDEQSVPIVAVEDEPRWGGEGPLVGLYSGLGECDTEWLALLSVDLPDLSLDLHACCQRVAESEASLAAAPVDGEGFAQWTCGVFHRSVFARCGLALEQGERSLHRFARAVGGVSFVPQGGPQRPFLSLNTPERARQAGWTPSGAPGAWRSAVPIDPLATQEPEARQSAPAAQFDS